MQRRKIRDSASLRATYSPTGYSPMSQLLERMGRTGGGPGHSGGGAPAALDRLLVEVGDVFGPQLRLLVDRVAHGRHAGYGIGAAGHLRLVGPLVRDVAVGADVEGADGKALLGDPRADTPLGGGAHPVQVERGLAGGGGITNAFLLGDEALRLVGADARLDLHDENVGLGAEGEGALDQSLRPVVLGGGLRQVFGDRYLAAGADAFLLGDERFRRLGGGSGQRYLLLDRLGGEAQREGATHQVQGDALLVGDFGQVFGDFGPISHGRYLLQGMATPQS